MSYYAVIFTSTRTEGDQGYSKMGDRMVELAKDQPGFLGIESARDDQLGITVSYWESEDAIEEWKVHAEHMVARTLGKEKWYKHFHLRVAKVEREYRFTRPD